MKLSQALIFIAFAIAVGIAATIRSKRAAYELPDGVEYYIPNIRTTFQCPGDGMYADIDNECQIFHVCVTQEFPNGEKQLVQHSFACGNETIFNQFSMTCDHKLNVKCEASAEFHYLNQKLGDPQQFIHDESDVERASAVFGNRIA